MSAAKTNDEFQRRLLETFREEADEHVRALSAGLVELEQAKDAERKASIIETLFRETHSLKGAARAVNLLDLETLCQSLESIMASLRRGKHEPTAETLDVLHLAVNAIEKLLPASGREPNAKNPSSSEVVRKLQALLAQETGTPSEPAWTKQPERAAPPLDAEGSSVDRADTLGTVDTVAPTDTVRVAAKRLELLLRQAEGLVPTRLAAMEHSAELRRLGRELARAKGMWAELRPISRELRRLLDPERRSRDAAVDFSRDAAAVTQTVGDLVDRAESHLSSIERTIGQLSHFAESEARSLQTSVTELLGGAKELLMLSFSYLTEILPAMARDLSRQQGKELELITSGTDVEIDRRLLQEMREPVIHLVRNCVDHGIESPERRAEVGKPRRGTVTVAVRRLDATKVEITVADDGPGIDALKVKAAAVKQGAVSAVEAEAMTEREAQSLVFRSGVSTSPLVTDLSGRGLGLAIVREKVEFLGGAVAVESTSDRGTTFCMHLPVTFSTLRGVLVSSSERNFIVPINYVARAVFADDSEIRTVANRETIAFEGQAISFSRLQAMLELPRKRTAPGEASRRTPVIVVRSADQHVAIGVDRILGELEVLQKGLGRQLQRVRNIGAAAILSNGEVVPILNVPSLVAASARAAAAGVEEPLPRPRPEKRKSILVVEDSITARTLIKNILEAAGFDVATAVDGAEGLASAREGSFDLVVSDVDMPRMNGFDLTAKIRSDRRLSDLPVVLITALESRQDRERGIEVGANAYIVKSSFEQSNLLEVIGRII